MLLATVAIDPPIVAALGALFVVFTARAIARGEHASRSVLVGAFIGAWLGASFGLHAFKYPAWMLCYAIDPRVLPTLLWYPLFLALLVVCGGSGGYLAHRFLAAGNRRGALLLVGALALLWIALFALTLPRYLVIGTYEQFRAGAALPLSAQPEVRRDFDVVSVMTALGPLALLAALLRRERRLAQLRAQSASRAGVGAPVGGAPTS